jgi:ribonuclease HI
MDLKISGCFTNWFKSFLDNRNYHVTYGNVKSKTVKFNTGVPQGSVSGPVLFILFISSLIVGLNGLNNNINNNNCKINCSFYADDGHIYCSDRKVENCINSLQVGLNYIYDWSVYNDMPLALDKSEAIIFSEYMPEIKGDKFDKLIIGGETIPWKTSVKLLGVVFDSSLCGIRHVKSVCKNANFRLHQISCIVSSSWGPSAMDMRCLYLAYVRSVILYGSTIYYPWLSESSIEKIQRVCNRGARIITGCCRSTEFYSLCLESNLVPIDINFKINLICDVEKIRRFNDDHPLNLLSFYPVRPSLKETRESWNSLSDIIMKTDIGLFPGGRFKKANYNLRSNVNNLYPEACPNNLFNIGRRQYILNTPRLLSWNVVGNIDHITFGSTLWRNYDHESDIDKRLASNETVDKFRDLCGNRFGFECWSDGAVSDNLGIGVSCIYDIGGYDNYIGSIVLPAGFMCSSYKAEFMGILAGWTWCVDKIVGEGILLFFTDSQSVVRKLAAGPLNQTDIIFSQFWKDMLDWVNGHRKRYIRFQYIAAHCGVIRNEAADNLATQLFPKITNKACMKNVPLSIDQIKCYTKKKFMDEFLFSVFNINITNYARSKRSNVSFDFTNLHISKLVTRKEYVNWVRLRVDEHPLIGKLFARICGHEVQCRWCGLEEESVQHVFCDCENYDIAYHRYNYYLDDDTYFVWRGLEVLEKHPLMALDYLEFCLGVL